MFNFRGLINFLTIWLLEYPAKKSDARQQRELFARLAELEQEFFGE